MSVKMSDQNQMENQRKKSGSLYLQWIHNHMCLLAFCLMISAVLCILTWPGILYTDSYTRIAKAEELGKSIQSFFQGEHYIFSSWITIIPSFFILASLKLTGSIVLYTFFQCFFFFLMVYAFGSACVAHRFGKIWMILWITVCPVMWAYGVYYEASVGCVTALMAILLIIRKWENMETKGDKILSVLLLVFCSFLCFGYRANAFTVLPILLIYAVTGIRKKRKSLLPIITVCAGLFLTFAIPKILWINTMSSYAASFLWETISTIQTVQEDEPDAYNDYFDDIFGSGETEKVLQRNEFRGQNASVNTMFGGNIQQEYISSSGTDRWILAKYVKLILAEPKAWLETKWEFVSHTLGIGKLINQVEYDYNRGDQMGTGIYSFNDSLQRLFFVNGFNNFMNRMTIFRMPWLLYLLAMALLLLQRVWNWGWRRPVTLLEAGFWSSVFYYGAYVLNTQSFEFRYFFPSWLLLYLIIFASVSEIASTLIQKNKNYA